MKTVLVLSFLLAGCAHAPIHDAPQTAAVAPIPCGPGSCGKQVVWENR